MKEFNIRTVNGENVITFTRIIDSANIIEVEAGTNGNCGGDTGHGSRTYFRITDLGGTDMNVNIIDDKSFEVCFGGDCELYTIREALRFILRVLAFQIETMKEADAIIEGEKELPLE